MKKSSQDRDIKDVLEGGEVSVPIDGMDEPRFRREGGRRHGAARNKKFVEGDVLGRPERRQGQEARARATAKTRSASFSAATSLSTCSWTTWNCPISPSESWPRSSKAFAGRVTDVVA